METTKNITGIEKDSLELVLEEFAEEQKSHVKSIADLVSAVNVLTNKFNSFEEKLNTPKGISLSTDTRPIQEIVRKGIIDMKLTAAGQPKNVIRKFQLLLFPEQDAKLFYKIVFGRWVLGLVVMVFLTNVYKFSIRWCDNQKEIKLQQLENYRIKRAWNYLYSQSGLDIKKIMDDARTKSYSAKNK
ncbi:hypothetical protein [[Flexibacter] sp. ATCC 35208]|uniref:hypothetical protein n=1 Tax=[Flexibacter] sp. ATCC 35208 TaxID=1936242 RepID=UPI0009CBAA11|nr:hypothetical protein [[Flexibacter] sp. ATCC 35208]OMP74963.1 hypothetical protein BW716_32585 [[Flexibacter] sp. ATCC 35208]